MPARHMAKGSVAANEITIRLGALRQRLRPQRHNASITEVTIPFPLHPRPIMKNNHCQTKGLTSIRGKKIKSGSLSCPGAPIKVNPHRPSETNIHLRRDTTAFCGHFCPNTVTDSITTFAWDPNRPRIRRRPRVYSNSISLLAVVIDSPSSRYKELET